MPETIYDLLWIFFIYAFLGWCVEVAFHAVSKGVFINRGFLNGPWCPIYGCGMLLVVGILYPLRSHLLILFFGSVILTSALEFVTGFVLEKLFHSKWWDYSDLPFNIMGYVCLKFSLYWGLAGTFVIDIIHPILFGLMRLIPQIVGDVLLGVLIVAMLVDISFTVSTILKINRRLKLLDDLSKGLRQVSDDIGENLFENVETLNDLAQDARLVLSESAMENRTEFEAKHEEQVTRWKAQRVSQEEQLAAWKAQQEERRETQKEQLQAHKESRKERLAAWKAQQEVLRENRRMQLQDKFQDWRSQHEESLQTWKEQHQPELQEIRKKYQDAFSKQTLGERRLIKAFPTVRFHNRSELMDKYRKYTLGDDEPSSDDKE